ncbi:MAG: hypothetical protein NTZ49_04475 [Candidatus Parcubacteria bacterium]|nr:hypothetical protein [Candidatus Parcubacteria bacterium]
MNRPQAEKKQAQETIFLKPGEDFDQQLAKLLGEFESETRETVELVDPTNPKHRKQLGEISLALKEAENEVDKLDFDESLDARKKLKQLATKLRKLQQLQAEEDQLQAHIEQTNKNLKSRLKGDPTDPLRIRKRSLEQQLQKVRGAISETRQAI